MSSETQNRFLSKEEFKIELGNGTGFLLSVDFENLASLDADDLLFIYPNALPAEKLFFPVWLGKLGILNAWAKNRVRSAKMNLERYEAKRREEIRNEFIEEGKKATVQAVDDALLLDKTRVVNAARLHKAEFQQEMIDSLYWAYRAKSMSLERQQTDIRLEEVTEEMLNRLSQGLPTKLRKVFNPSSK